MPIGRFFIFWICDYVVATVVVFVLSAAGRQLLNTPELTSLSVFFIPIATMFFSWIAYRGLERESVHRLAVAGAWVGLAVLVDSVVSIGFRHLTFAAFFSSPLVLAVYGTKFMAVFVGAYLGLDPQTKNVGNDPTLLPR